MADAETAEPMVPAEEATAAADEPPKDKCVSQSELVVTILAVIYWIGICACGWYNLACAVRKDEGDDSFSMLTFKGIHDLSGGLGLMVFAVVGVYITFRETFVKIDSKLKEIMYGVATLVLMWVAGAEVCDGAWSTSSSPCASIYMQMFGHLLFFFGLVLGLVMLGLAFIRGFLRKK